MVKSYFLQMINCEGKGSITLVTLYLEVTPKNGTTLSSHHVRHLHLLGVTAIMSMFDLVGVSNIMLRNSSFVKNILTQPCGDDICYSKGLLSIESITSFTQ